MKISMETVNKVHEAWSRYSRHFNMTYMFDLADIWTEEKAIVFLELVNKSITDNKDYMAERYGIDVAKFRKPNSIIID